jgi:hypothetical protein
MGAAASIEQRKAEYRAKVGTCAECGHLRDLHFDLPKAGGCHHRGPNGTGERCKCDGFQKEV